VRKPLPEPPLTRSISDPTSYQPFAGFSCGDKEDHEQDVNDALVGLLDLPPKQAESVEFRVAETQVTRDLIGTSAFLKKPLPTKPEQDAYADAVYLAVLAISESYRGTRMPDGTRIGTFLLCDAFCQIARKWGDSIPPVWALVHHNNDPCQRLLRSNCFWSFGGNADYLVHLRPEGYHWTRGFSPQMIEAVETASDD
jgi:ribosomal protein S18 acetylase RimI-like enzyme